MTVDTLDARASRGTSRPSPSTSTCSSAELLGLNFAVATSATPRCACSPWDPRRWTRRPTPDEVAAMQQVVAEAIAAGRSASPRRGRPPTSATAVGRWRAGSATPPSCSTWSTRSPEPVAGSCRSPPVRAWTRSRGSWPGPTATSPGARCSPGATPLAPRSTWSTPPRRSAGGPGPRSPAGRSCCRPPCWTPAPSAVWRRSPRCSPGPSRPAPSSTAQRPGGPGRPPTSTCAGRGGGTTSPSTSPTPTPSCAGALRPTSQRRGARRPSTPWWRWRSTTTCGRASPSAC